jgi:hypothetical protein
MKNKKWKFSWEDSRGIYYNPVFNVNCSKMDRLTTSTSSTDPLTKKECIEEIIDCLSEYATKKWYQEKKYLLERAIFYTKEYNKLK